MSRIYLPHAEQFDLMNENLAKIANALAASIDLSTWAGIQKAVRVGVAPDLIPVGTQLKVSHSVYGDMLYDVVAHNHFKSAYDKRAHTMTLLCHDTIGGVQFDKSEAFYYANEELPSGTYHFTIATYGKWTSGTYQFTLTRPLPVGGQLCIYNYATIPMTSCEVSAFESNTSTTPIEKVAITAGNDGAFLGTFGNELNSIGRVAYGSNNYKESAIRQFLNSSAETGRVWTPQTKFDRPPDWMGSKEGFMRGLNEDFLSVIGEVVVPCSANNIYEFPDSTVIKSTKYTVNDKFYLASQSEVFGTSTGVVVDESVQFPYYREAINADRIKRANSSAVPWWLRSCVSWDDTGTYYVMSNGSLTYSGAGDGHRCVPVCTIV